MATTTTFHIPAPLKKAEVVAADYQEDDAIAFTLDDNPNTSWITDNAAEQYIEIDTKYDASHPTVNSFGIFIRNYLTNWGTTGEGVKIRLGYSNTQGASYTYDASWISSPFVDHNGGVLWIVATSSAYDSYRYYRIGFDSLPVSPEMPDIGQLFLMSRYALEARKEYPLKDQPTYLNKFAQLHNGRRLAMTQALDSVTSFERNFTLRDATNKGYWDAIIDGTQGGRKPLIIQEGTTVDEMVWAYLLDHSIEEIDEDYYKAKMQLQQVPYIRDGEVI